jgi:hypothetical protein
MLYPSKVPKFPPYDSLGVPVAPSPPDPALLGANEPLLPDGPTNPSCFNPDACIDAYSDAWFTDVSAPFHIPYPIILEQVFLYFLGATLSLVFPSTAYT